MAKKSKASKHRQAPKDFAKERRKVGKAKRAPANETRTDFRVKQVQMPAQSALTEKGDEVTHRRLGLLDLLAHTQHHSSKVRRDAFDGLHELCTAHDGVLHTSLAKILDVTTTAAIDSSAEVRASFRGFQSWMIGALPQRALAAFAPTFALHVRSALSHVSSEIRDDGLLLLELYVSQLAGTQVFSQAETARVIKTLCQLTVRTDTVLSCLHRLLRPPPLRPRDTPEAGSSLAAEEEEGSGGAAGGGGAGDPLWSGGAPRPQQIALHAALHGQLQGVGTGGPVDSGGYVGIDAEHHAQRCAAVQPLHDDDAGSRTFPNSPIWSFCIRVWLQTGDLPSAGVAGSRACRAVAKPGIVRLQCVAVLERALECAARGVSGTTPLRPSVAQVDVLVGMVRRSEWPLRVDQTSSLRNLADSVNLRMAHVIGLLVTGGAPPDVPQQHLARLARAALSFLEDFSQLPWADAGGGGASVGAAEIDPNAAVGPFTVAACCGYALRSLDLLWASTEAARGNCAVVAAARGWDGAFVHPQVHPVLGPGDTARLAAVTARLSSGGIDGPQDDAAAVLTAPAILALPLTASLLGLQPECVASRAPTVVQPGWPEALAMAKGPGLAEAVERFSPGVALKWVTAWPKLLYYLGGSDPALSGFILALLLTLAKLASQSGSLHERLLAASWPLLVPFLTGEGHGRDAAPPPLALLPPGLAGPQGLAAALLPHFLRLTEPLASVLTGLICRWSDVGAAGDGEGDVEAPAPARLGTSCCELVLEALLRGRGLGGAACNGPSSASARAAAELMPLRLRVALTVLCASPAHEPPSSKRAERAEFAALRLADRLADWLSSYDCAASSLGKSGAELGYDDQRRLALQTLAWPLCTRLIQTSPALAPRALCFLFFCAARLPPNHGGSPHCHGTAAGRVGFCSLFLSELFEALVGSGSGRALHPQGVGLAAAVARRALCDPARAGGQGGASGTGVVAIDVDAAQRLPRMFVATWMRVVAGPERAAAYELLVKLCTQQLTVMGSAAGSEGQTALRSAQWAMTAGCTSVLLGAIAYRNEHGLPTEGWGLRDLGRMDTDLASMEPESIRRKLADFAHQGTGGGAGEGSVGLAAMLPLL